MKIINQYILEKLHLNKDIDPDSEKYEDRIYLNKLVKALKTVFNDKLTVCTDYQGDKDKGRYYEINPETLGTGNGRGAERFVNYCKKIDNVKVEEFNGDILFHAHTKITSGKYWINIIWGRGNHSISSIRINKAFYDDCPFKKDQSNVTQRGWDKWKNNSF